MFGNVIGKKKKFSEIEQKVSKMNLADMRNYVNTDVTEAGLEAIMKKLTIFNERTKSFYLKTSDMDSKKKKAFDLVLSISGHIKITMTVAEEIQEFFVIYAKIIKEYDKEKSDIYTSRFDSAVLSAMDNLYKQATLQRKENVLGN